MFSVIIVPDGCRGPEEQHRLEPGHTLRFGRTAPAGNGLTISHPAVACAAGEITATGAFWILTNFSSDQTYIVENPEGAGEHIRVAPGRADAPVPFEFARVHLCAGGSGPGGPGLGESRPGCGFDVLAPRHDYLTPGGSLIGGPVSGGAVGGAVLADDGARDAEDWSFDPFPRPYPLDHTCHYFLVLAALCEASLRAGDAAAAAPVPDVAELTQRLRPVWPDVTPAAVTWNLDYLRLKLRLRTPDDPGTVREALVRFALRFDLVQEGHLAVLDGQLV
ncbi:hypothetical protein [Streptomyces oryzae]|uniref:hypothetical protein n=1 Tax=Streptomyces oryzae TaxID=1434886 RepID=UPI0027DEA7CA|nr:hypothetical protein [Streptomyces oryzae]